MNKKSFDKINLRLLVEESRSGSELAFYLRSAMILIIMLTGITDYILFNKDLRLFFISLLVLGFQSFLTLYLYNKGVFKNLYGYITISFDITVLVIHNVLSSKGSFILGNASIFLFFIIILFSAMRQSKRIIAFSTLLSVISVIVIYSFRWQSNSLFLNSDLSDSSFITLIFKCVYLVLFGVFMIIYMNRLHRTVNKQSEYFLDSLSAKQMLEKEKVKKRRLEDRLRLFIRNLKTDYFFISQDGEGNMTYVSESVNNILGYTPDYFINNISDIVLDSDKNKTIIKEAWKNVKDKNPPPYELDMLSSDGRIRKIEILEVPIFDKQKNIISIEGLAHDITVKKNIENVLKKSEQKIKNYARRVVEIREEEKKRLSADLHDELGTMAIAIGANLNLASSDIKEKEYKNALSILNRTNILLKDSIVKLKSIAKELRPPNIDMIGIAASLQLYFEEIENKHDLRISFNTNIRSNNIPEDISINIYRIAQEAITNVLKYSKAKKVNVKLKEFRNRLEFIIKDNGQGFKIDMLDMETGAGKLGIIGMKERVEALSGNFHINSAITKGTEIIIEIPVRSKL